MKVILDSSVFIRDFQMDSPSFRTFLSQHAIVGHQFIMLEIVRDEVLNKYKELLFEQKCKIDSGIKDIRSKTGTDLAFPIADEDIAQMVAEYERHLHELLRQFKATILGYPSVPHKKIVDRALQRKKPFDSNGQKGYRDVLIWELILELISREPSEVAFVSQNPRDFADNSNVLHQDLRNDISALNNDNISVIYYPNLDSFVSEEITPRLEVLGDITAQLLGDGYKGFDLLTFTSSQLYKFIETQELNPTDIDLPRSFETLQIGYIEDVSEIDNVAVYSLPEDDLLVVYEGLVSASFSFFIEHHEYLSLHDDLLEKIEVWEPDWNDYYRLCHIAMDEVILEIKLVLNRENAIVKSVELVNISLDSWIRRISKLKALNMM